MHNLLKKITELEEKTIFLEENMMNNKNKWDFEWPNAKTQTTKTGSRRLQRMYRL